ncbi:hypothetical protein LCGC14_0596490 [marine sediment metagenome]|uniref:Uncharacterized protein n=1 Tax=marine sediment metagenome TaxID=412755 RepID=A0A0F9RGV3_9ZZZZ|nr:MAG: hypothetical protein Lokiarch_48280 [Candidatus Lokiarchaeum sp. GC14_75]HEC39008.1 hypothetical protein [bacterium]
MSSQKFLSNKKTSHQTISISPALKEWIIRYVKVNHQKNQEDSRFKSVSSFYYYIMERIMVLFKKGKTLDDLEKVEDKKIKDFFDRFTFKATIPLYEMVIEPNKYTPFTFEFNTRFLLLYLDLFKKEVKSHNFNDMGLFFEKIRSRYAKTNVSKDMRLELSSGKDREPVRGTLEFIGKYRNLHFENCKFFAAVFGILGARVTDFIYSPDDYYCRLEACETDLMFNENLAKKERLKLIEENINYIINYNRMLDDKDLYLWMKLAEDSEMFVSFKNQTVFNKWIKNIEVHLRRFGKKEEFLAKILLFFNKLHWIRIENIKTLSFQIERAIEESKEQKRYFYEYLSNISEISQKDGIFYLK